MKQSSLQASRIPHLVSFLTHTTFDQPKVKHWDQLRHFNLSNQIFWLMSSKNRGKGSYMTHGLVQYSPLYCVQYHRHILAYSMILHVQQLHNNNYANRITSNSNYIHILIHQFATKFPYRKRKLTRHRSA